MVPSSLSLQRTDASIEITPSSNIQPIANGDTSIGQSQQPILGEFNEREHELNANPAPGEWSQADGIAEEEIMTDESNIHGTNPTDQDGNPTASQPLQTLKKLQQMLDETDYMTTKSATSRGDDINFPLPTSASNHQQHQNHNQQRQHPFVATATPTLKPDENTARDPIPPDHPFNHRRLDPPPELPPQYLYQQDLDANGPQNAQQPIMFEKDLDLPPAHPYQSQQLPPTPDELTTSSNVAAVQATNNQNQRQTQPPAPQQNNQEQDAVRPLWTSKDRSKYKKDAANATACR
ncbi:hypothetical protein MHU86_16703 [Fragilaria crotonensis]|nr:hypothetical protein MHU86_16703 [Fragilaria crotonensis]